VFHIKIPYQNTYVSLVSVFLIRHKIDIDIDQFITARARFALEQVRAVEVEVPVPASEPERFQLLQSFPVVVEDFDGSAGRRHGVDLEAELFDVGQYSRREHRLQYCPLAAFHVHLQVVDDFLHTRMSHVKYDVHHGPITVVQRMHEPELGLINILSN